MDDGHDYAEGREESGAETKCRSSQTRKAGGLLMPEAASARLFDESFRVTLASRMQQVVHMLTMCQICFVTGTSNPFRSPITASILFNDHEYAAVGHDSFSSSSRSSGIPRRLGQKQARARPCRGITHVDYRNACL